MRAEESSNRISQRKANRNGEIKNAQDPAALGLGKQISYKGGRNCDKTRFTHAHQRMPKQESVIAMDERRKQGHTAPGECAQGDDESARVPVG